MSDNEPEVCAYDDKSTSLRGLCDAALAASKAYADAPTEEAEYEAWNCLQDMRRACDAKTIDWMLNQADTLKSDLTHWQEVCYAFEFDLQSARAENARLREALLALLDKEEVQDFGEWLEARMKQARAALEVKP
jgi:hypothetical protein